MLNLKDEYFPIKKLWMVDAVIPDHKQIMGLGRGRELNVKGGMSQSAIQEIAVQAGNNSDKVV